MVGWIMCGLALACYSRYPLNNRNEYQITTHMYSYRPEINKPCVREAV
jgi:hypothetical protein